MPVKIGLDLLNEELFSFNFEGMLLEQSEAVLIDLVRI